MFNAIKCCQASVECENEEVVDGEVKKIYKAIKHDSNDGMNKYESTAYKTLNEFIINYKKSKVNLADSLRNFRKITEDSKDTLLHTAALCNRDSDVIGLLLKNCPDLINIDRTGNCLGQTALHITIAKEKIRATAIILKQLVKSKNYKILSARATGPNFVNTIMMGETALSVAVLTLNIEMVDLLLKAKASVAEVNSKGDTVIHTLIKYTALERKHISKAIGMLKHLKKEWFDKFKTLWFIENQDRLTPLKLAVKEGLIDIVQVILNMKNIYCFKSHQDGYFNSRFYDITEIDPAAQREYSKLMEEEKSNTENDVSCLTRFGRQINAIFCGSPPPSVVEMMSDLKWTDVQNLVDLEIIKLIVLRRWDKCETVYYVCGFVHLCVMLLFTLSVYYRQYIANSSHCKVPENWCQEKEIFSQVVPWILMVFGLFLLVSEFYRFLILKQGLRFLGKRHNNTLYRVCLLLFALSLIVDCILYANGRHSNDVFVTVLLSGSWFFLFFFRGIKMFSFYTVLFHKIIMGDLFRFGIIIVIEFSAFSFAMYIILSGNEAIEEFSTFENTTLTMFGYMLGLKDLDLLKDVDIESQRLVAGIYVLFIITTYIILINSLIAMMTSTSQAPAGERHVTTLLLRSSVSLFLDGILFKRSVIHTKPKIRRVNEKRFYIPLKIKEIGNVMSQKMSKENFTLKDVRNEFTKMANRYTKGLVTLRKEFVDKGTQVEAPTASTSPTFATSPPAPTSPTFATSPPAPTSPTFATSPPAPTSPTFATSPPATFPTFATSPPPPTSPTFATSPPPPTSPTSPTSATSPSEKVKK